VTCVIVAGAGAGAVAVGLVGLVVFGVISS
jgi:hypothetical protein